MGVGYKPVLWNRQKRRYDSFLLLGIAIFLGGFIGFNIIFHPEITPETLIIRSAGLTAFIMLHIILCIGPLSRLDRRFLPILYNRRHFGVIMAVFALVHGLFSIIQFHGLGNLHPLVSLFVSNTHYGNLMRFPFQPLGFFALLILLLMASTSHDFWLKNLGPAIWKSLHMLVYVAFALLIMHVMLGIIQLEQSPIWIGAVGLAMAGVIGLHMAAAWKGASNVPVAEQPDGFYRVCEVSDIETDRATMVLIGEENIAIFRYDGKLSAVNNLCKHQNGPLGEGKVIDGCITCPWHGYQYRPEDGCSPPPFTEKVATYTLKLEGNTVYVNPKPHPEGTPVEPIIIAS